MASAAKTDKQEIGEHDPCEGYSEEEFVLISGLVYPAPGDHVDHKGRKDHSQSGQDKEDDEQPGKDCICKMEGAFFRVFRKRFGEYRDEGRGHGAFGEKFTQEIRDAVSNVKRVSSDAGAEGPGHDHVANIPHDAADERGKTDDARGFCDFDLF